MSDQVRVGVISTSWWVDLVHCPYFKSHPRAELVAICGRNRDRAERMAKKYEIPLVFTDYREMIEKGGLDAIVVATPDDLHYPMTMDALDAGLNVICEKPMATNAEQAREMYEKAEARGVKHMLFFEFRWMPHHRYLGELMSEGYIGRGFHCYVRWLLGYARSGRYAWRLDRRRANGVLGDLGSHMIDLARWYMGDVAKVSANLSTFVERSEAESQPLDQANDSALLILEFENGAQGIVHVSAVAHVGDRGQEQYITLHGEAGTLETAFIPTGEDIVMEVRGARKDEERIRKLPIPEHIKGDVDGSKPSWLLQVGGKQAVDVFVNSIIEDRPISPSFYDGLKVQEIIDAAIESDRRGCWISLQGGR